MHWNVTRISAALFPPMAAPAPIDAVYTWVDGDRADYQALVRRYAVAPQDMNPERFRDPFACLRHSLRSLEEFAPWVRHVYLFTCRPHVPAWIRRDHPRLRLVHHDEVVDVPDVLPTFNSNVVETFLHRLPGLSDRFLFFNDDYFLGAPLAPEHYFTPDGRLRVFGGVLGERFRCRIYERQLASFGLLEHLPSLLDRQLWAEMLAAAPGEIAAHRRHRFRRAHDIRPERLYRWHALTHAGARFAAEPFWRCLRHARFLKLRDHPTRLPRLLARLRARRPLFFCLNDDLGPQPRPASLAAVRAFLTGYFPTPSSFEIPAT